MCGLQLMDFVQILRLRELMNNSNEEMEALKLRLRLARQELAVKQRMIEEFL